MAKRTIIDCPKCNAKGWYETTVLVPVCEKCKGQGKVNKVIGRTSGRKKLIWHREMQAKAAAEFRSKKKPGQRERKVPR